MTYIDTHCFSCGKDCDTKMDWLSFFDDSLCADCQAEMYREMALLIHAPNTTPVYAD